MNEQEVKKLYQALLSKGYSTQDLGDEQRFLSKMGDANNRKQLYDWVSSKGNFRIGDYNAYEARLTGGTQQEHPSADNTQDFTMSESELEGNPQDRTVIRTAQPQQPSINIPSVADTMEEHKKRTAMPPVFQNETGLDEEGNRVTKPKVENVHVPGTPSPQVYPVYRDFMGNEYDATDQNVQSEAGSQVHTQQIDLAKANREQVAELSQSIDDALNESKGEVMRLYRENAGKAYPLGVPGADPTEMQASTRMMQKYGDGIPEAQAAGQRVRDLEAAQRSMRDAQRIINEADHNAKEGTLGKWLESSFAGGAARGFGQKLFDVETWDMGLSDAQDASVLMSALNAFDKGEQLTESQQALLDAKAVELATNAYFGSYVGRGYKAGNVTAESVPFMIEMCLNPASGTGHAAQNVMARYAIKRFGKKVVKDNAKKYLATKVATRVAGDIAGSSIMAATTGSVGVTADAINRMNGDVQYDTNDEGLSVFAGHTEGDDFGEAFGKAFASRTIENYSEMMGEYFAPVLGWAGKGVRKGLGKVGLEGVNDFIENVAASDVARVVGDFEKNAKWNGVFGEYAEEVAGGIMNALVVGDQTLDADPETGVFNLDNNIDTFLGVSLMGGFMSGIKTAGYRTPKYRARQDMMAKDDAAASVFGNQDTWVEIRNTIAVGDDADAKQKLAEVLGNPDFTPEQRAAALDYAKAVQAYRGMLKGEEKRREEQDPTQTDLETSFDNGYSLESNQEMNDAKNMLDYQRQRIGGFATDDMLNQLDADPVGALNAIRVNEAWTDEEKQTATDYVNAKATYDGMIQHIQDDIESQINASNSLIDGRVHPDDGMIHPATMKTNDRKVYVIGGNLAMNDDGTMVDRENSDESIIVRDAETGSIEFADPRDVLSTDETIDAAQEKQIAQEAIRQQYAQEAANKIDGVLPFNEGDTYQVVDGDGEQHTITVDPIPVDDNGMPAPIPEGEVLVSIDGTEPITVPSEQVQQMADNANLARLAEFEQGKAAQREAEAEAEREANRPVYNINDEITLQTDEGTVRGSITADANEDGLIEVYTERPIGGKKINLYNRDELDAMVVQHNGVTQEPVAEVEPQPTEQPTGESVEAADDAMPMIGEGDEAEPDFMNTTPERAHSYIYNEAGLSRDEANQFVEANKKAADKALEKAKNTKPKMGTSLAKYRKEQTEYQQKVDAAQKVADYWKKVKDAQQLVLSAEQEERAKQNEAVHEQAVIEEQARQAEELRKREEQAALGTNNVAPAIREKWEAAPKVEGARNEIVLANGEHVPGRYVLVESGAATPSHNPRAEFVKNEGFPQDENGQSVNDRDYERDKDAQSTTRQIASIYDQRALQTPVVVTNDGIVLSGNGRTMAGELAAQDNTDGAYIEHLKQYGSQFGFAPEQVEGMQHPRVVFVPDEAMPYTADTFAKFNQQEMKGQNKTEQAVKLGKIVGDDTFSRIIRSINGYNTLGEYYADTQATTQAINELRDAGAISQAQYGEMFDGETISAQGREMLENMLIGKAFESNPDAVRQITAFKGVRQGIITALAEISNNIMLGDEYSHEADLAQAINLVYQARNAGYKAGEKVSNFARQLNLFPFDEGATVADADNATVLMFADLLNEGKPTLLKKALALYNQAAKDSANGQLDIFSGDVRSREEILDEVRQLLKYGTEEQQQAALDAATAERVAASQPIVQEDGTTGTSNQDGETAGSTGVEAESPVAAAEREVNTNPTEAQKEAGNYKKGHVKIDGYDVTIENPKGSERSGTDASGKQWRQTMHNTYGYIRGTEGVDGDHIDVFLSDAPESGNVYVIDQRNADGSFDEHKVMYGFNSAEEARDAYLSNYEEGWQGLGAITEVSKDEFKKWIDSSHRKTKPFAEYKSVKPIGAQNEGTTPSPYSIEPTTYTNKKGKETPMFLVKFGSDLTKEQIRAGKELARESKGWWDREQGGFMMRSEDAANELAEALSNEDAVADAQPMSLQDMAAATEQLPTEQDTNDDDKVLELFNSINEGDVLVNDTGMTATILKKANGGNATNQAISVKWEQSVENGTNGHAQKIMNAANFLKWYEANKMRKQEENPNANYKVGDTVIFLNSNKTARLKGKIVRVDKTESFGTEYEVESIIVTDNGPGKGVTSRPHTYTILEGQIESKVAAQPQQTEQQKRLVSDERMEELKARLRKKMFGQLNMVMGVDPEILAIGAELAVGHIERGLTKFSDYAKTMIEDLGDAIRPYLKAFYNAVRDMPEAEEYAEKMDSYDDVRTFDLLSVRPEGETSDTTAGILERAEEVAKEQEAEEQAEVAKGKLTEQRNDGRKVQSEGVALDGTPLRAITEKDLDNRDAKFYHQGKRVYIFAVMRSGEQVSATQFSEPHLDNIYLTNGQSIKPEELMVADETKEPVDNNSVQKILDIAKKGKKPSKSKKKDVTLQSPSFMGDLFNENTEDNGHERTDAARTEGLSADGTDSGERSLRANGQEVGQESGRTDRRRAQGGVESVRHRLHDGLRPSDQLTNTPTEQRRTRQPLERPSNPKNLRNNHAERGKSYAPKGVDSRIDANIKAIELMKQLMESGEQATPEQMAVLRQFSGWGGLGKAFENFTAYTNGKPTPQYLRELLGEEAYQQANMSRNSAYYTPANVIDAMWDVAKAMGFQGGNVLEGSAGIGDIIGHMPTDMSERSNIHAVEIDQTTGNILSLLYPDAKVDVQGFEATQVENGSIDLAITNVPFVTGLRVNDTTGDKDLSKKFHDIHDFCIAKNVRKLREGGIGIFITSSGTLDNSAKLREWIIQEGGADVVGAFRMHNETFGGTGATSDIIVVRKRVNGIKSTHAIDVLSTTGERTADYDTGETKRMKGQEIPIIKHLSMDYNSYFVEHPEMMAGEMHFGFEKGETFRPTSKALYPSKDKNQDEMLKAWAESFAEKEWESYSVPNGALPDGAVDVYEDLGEGVKEGSIVVSNGQLCIAQRGKAVPLAVNANKVKGKTKVQCFEAYQGIKKALADLLQYQTENENDAGLKPLLQALNKAYDSFVKTYGHLHKNTAISFLKNDVDFANIVALESFTELGDGKGGVTREYGKTDIFSQRVVDKEKAPEPKDVKDGIIASIYVHGRIDLPWIVDKLNAVNGQHTEESVKAEIIASGLGFENPATRQMEVSYEYLSGNVREKLAQAQANNSDGQYDANIKALEAVIPMNIPAHLIDFSIGSSWIDPKLYEEYVKEKTDIDVKFTTAGGTWFMKTPYYVAEQKNRAMGVVSEMLHKTIMGTQLIEAAMQNKTITVSETHKKWDGSTETITDKEATQACSNKIDEIRQDFKDWARAKMQSDPTMSEHIERIYNEMFNNYVPKSIPDEFVPAHFGGAATMVDGKEFALRPHQAKAAIRGTTQPLLLAHEVGSGKTYTLITTAMEMRRLGIARKPMAVVQNATVGQFVESAKKLYPNAKVLTIEEADRTAEGRKNFYAKIKYNDWDMIVVPQSVFERIPDSEERQMKFVQDKIEERLLVLEQMKDSDPQGQSMIVRQAEKEIESLKDELAGLTDTISTKRKERDEKKRAVTMQNAEVKALEMLDRQTDDVENFDDMGIDAILVDEAHEYKHLGFATAMQRGVKGVDPSYSKKAQGVYLKTQAVLEKNNGRNVIFATGTPISNTAAEIWTFMRYLMPSDTMKEYGIFYFDDFVRNFGNLTQMLEFTTSGKFKENNRFAGYINLPELVRIWAGVADTVLNKDIEAQRIAEGKESKIPDMEDGKATDIYLPQTRALRSIMKFVKKRLDEYEKMSGREKKENSHIPLTMYGIAKAAAVDARLVMSDAADEPQSKTNEAVRQILKSLSETDSYKGTVAVFADNYQNKKSGFNLYEDIREKLIAQGVPAEQIIVMRSGMSVKKKLEIFDKVNRGEVRVIMGSTFTLGTGVNIQERLHTLIHLDAPNRPMDYTQRNGRILRQGNIHKDMNKPVRVLRFGVEDSLDVTAYQRLKTKGAIADSIMNGKQMMANSMENRALEEEEDVFGDTVAQLSGSEYAMLKNQAEKDVRKYEAKKKQYEADQTYCHNEIPRLEGEIKMWKEWLEKNRTNLATTESLPTEKTITVGKQTFASIDAMADFIKEYNKTIKEVENDLRDNPSLHSETRRLTVNVGGIDFVFTTEQSIETKQDQGTLFSAVRRKMTYSCEAFGLKDVPVRQSLLREGLEDIVKNVVSGKDFQEFIERGERNLDRCEKSLAQIRERFGKPFEYSKELATAHERLDEYAELMKKELEEKEKKYAEMDADVDEAIDITEAEEASEEEDNDDEDGKLYRMREEEPPVPVHFNAVTDEQSEALNKEIRIKEVQKRFDELNEKYNGKPVQFIRLDNVGDEDFFMAIGATEEDIAEMSVEEMHEQAEKLKKLFKSRHSIGGYSRLNRKITIFADRIEPNQAEEVFFHENIHGILHDWYEEEPRGIAEHFFDAAPKDGGFKDWAFIEKGYEGKELKQKKEEFFVYWLSKAMVEGRTQEILDMLDWEDSERIENILKNIGYERGREESERRKDEEDSGDSEETHGQFLPSLSGGRRNGQSTIGYDRRAEEVQEVAQRNLGQNVSGQLLERDGQPVLSHEESLASSRAAGYTKRQHEAYWRRTQRNMRFAADYTIRKLGLGGRVTVMESTEGLKGRKAKAKGWYDAATGKIVVILSNHGSAADVERTILHEGVAHFGLRKLFGGHFNQFLDNVYQYADSSVRSNIVELAKKHNWDFHTATEEYLARLAEDTNFENASKQGWWSRIKSLFLDMLHSIGLADYGGAVLTDNELRYILWRSYENLAEPGMYRNPFRVAEDVVMQSNLGVGNYEKSISRIFSSGGLDMSRQAAENMVTERGGKIHFRDGDFSERDRATARDAYERMVSSGTYQFREAVQDSMLGLEKLYKAILGKDYGHIENVEGYENAYLAENRMSSVNAAEQHDYYVNFMQPLLEAIGAIAGSKKGARQALTDYMMAKHGLERNLVFAERDAREVEANGGDFADAFKKFRENDYSGLTALTGEKDLAAAEAAAQQIVDDYEAAYDTSDLWNRTREATQATLEKIYRSGLLGREQYEKIRDMFQYYIPLQGWDETTSDEVYGYLTSRSGIGGSPIKHAVGRSSKADDPIATIAMMADSAIRQGNRNQMKQRFLNFVLNHPSDLVSVHDLWLEYDAAADEWKPVFADIEDGDTAADVERKVEAFEQRMAQLAEAEPDRYKRGSDAKNIPYKVVKGNLKEHQVLVKRGGQTYVLTINGNPRAAQALNGLTNPDVETSGVVGNMLKLGEYVNHKLSAFYTTRNPDFVVSNFFRDMLYSNCMTWVKESPRYALRFHKNFGRVNPIKMRILLGKWEKGTLDQSDYTERMFHQFMMNGGETGYTSVRDIEEHKKEIAEELKKQGSTVRKAWAALGMQLDLLNRGVENCARFAAFLTSREMGRSVDRSIYDAKEISVNFNKKGSGGKMVNATGQTLLGKVGSYVGGGGRLAYVFWNAGVQGMTNFGRAGKRHGGKAFAGASAMFILGYVIPQLAAAMGGGDGDDDDKNAYYNLPEYVRRSNICFRIGEQWITIPLPIEFRGIYGLGELASGVSSGNEHYDNKELTYQIASQVSQVLPLDMLEGGGGISPWIPSSAKPFAEAYIMNKGWTGLPIYKDTPWNQNDPEWTKAYKNADQTLVGASKWLNEATGGDDFKKGAIDINPAKIEYMLNGVFGGYMNTAEKLKKMGETALGNRDFDWRNMLLANRIVKSGDERTANRKLQNEYFKYKKEYEDTKRLLNKYESAADEGILGMAEKYDFLYNSPEYMRYELFDEYKSDIDDYREEIQEASDDAERKEIEADMYATMRELIDQLHEIK
jgi:N12 class adenine-specific DNA methylase